MSSTPDNYKPAERSNIGTIFGLAIIAAVAAEAIYETGYHFETAHAVAITNQPQRPETTITGADGKSYQCIVPSSTRVPTNEHF